MFGVWEPNSTELEILKNNPKRRKVTGNSTIGLWKYMSTYKQTSILFYSEHIDQGKKFNFCKMILNRTDLLHATVNWIELYISEGVKLPVWVAVVIRDCLISDFDVDEFKSMNGYSAILLSAIYWALHKFHVCYLKALLNTRFYQRCDFS
jgi:hypothetical protein